MEQFFGSSGPLGLYKYDYLFFYKNLFESGDIRNLQDLIYISLDLTEKLEQFSGPLGPHIYDYLFLKRTDLKAGLLGLLEMSLYLNKKVEQLTGSSGRHIYDYRFFKKTNLNIGIFGTFRTDHIYIYILQIRWKNSMEFRTIYE